VFIAFILVSRGDVPFSYLDIISFGFSENDISVLLNGIHLLIERIESIFADFVLDSINTFSNCSMNGMKFSLNQLNESSHCISE
jgi:hypothetical protein